MQGGHDHGKLITISKVNEDSPGRKCQYHALYLFLSSGRGRINVNDVLLHVS